jgi:hypothetical protein
VRAPIRKLSKAAPTNDDIARRAYELFIANGCEHGHDVDHWLQAERELVEPPARHSSTH